MADQEPVAAEAAAPELRPQDFNDSSPEDSDELGYDPHAEGYVPAVPGAIMESSYGFPMSED